MPSACAVLALPIPMSVMAASAVEMIVFFIVFLLLVGVPWSGRGKR